MKLLILFLSLISFNIYSQSKQETIDWLNDRFASSPFLKTVLKTESRHLKIFPDGSFEILCKNWNRNNSVFNEPDNYYTIKGNFKDLNPSEINTSVDNNKNLYIYVRCTRGNCIRQINDDGTSYFNSTALIGFLDISFEDTMESRSKKAFNHLTVLCGGKLSTF